MLTGEAESSGVPVPGESWPMGRWDHRRGKLVAVGESGLYQHPDLADDATPSGTQWEGEGGRHSHGQVLLYDTEQRRVEHGGFVPGMKWERRSLALDPDTGRFFGSTPGRPSTLLLLDPARPPAERFERTPLGTDSPIRAATRRRSAGGELILASRRGTLYGLDPDELSLREIGPAWTDGVWLTDLSLSPDGRSVYFVVDSTWTGRSFGVPVVRFDLDTGERTVLCRLAPTLFREHGYGVVGAYTAAVSADGHRLFVQLNGDDTDDPEEAQYGRPILVDIALPEVEPVKDR